MSGARNRTAGHNYERTIAAELRSMGFQAITSREGDRSLDSRGVDIVSDFPLPIQCKCSQNTPDIEGILDTAAKCVFWKKTRRSGSRFMPVGEYVIMTKQDFYKLIEQWKQQNNKPENDSHKTQAQSPQLSMKLF